MLKKQLFIYVCIGLLVSQAAVFISPLICYSAGARQNYMEADKAWLNLRRDPVKLKFRTNWIKCIKKYQSVFTQFPESLWAPAGMYRAAQLYFKLYKLSLRNVDKREAVDLLERIRKRYHSSRYRKRARQMLRLIVSESPGQHKKNKISIKYKSRKKNIVNDTILKNGNASPAKAKNTLTQSKQKYVKKNNYIHANIKHKNINKYAQKSSVSGKSKLISKKHKTTTEKYKIAGKAETKNKSIVSAAKDKYKFLGDAIVTGLRFWSNPEYTRVVVNADKSRHFTEHLLKRNPSLNKPQRLFIDIDKTRLGKNVPKFTAINDDFLIQTRAGQHTLHSVRVVVDIKSFDNYKVFSLKDPFRLVIDVWSKPGNKKVNGYKDTQRNLTRLSTENILSSKITKQLALGVRKIIIDPGHGGKDPGAPGYFKGVNEKDITLKIAKKLAKKMRSQLKCNVLLTRSRDHYLTLEERTAIANTKNADLFISIHCNASRNRRLRGIETYYLNLATDNQAIEVAARENATSRRNISDLESILNDLMKNEKINESSRLAADVQRSLCSGMKRKYSGIVNLGVKQAPFYVLIGARMPSILIETSFLSNKKECKRLLSSKYQNTLCDSIIKGVEKYIKATNPKRL